MGLRREPDLTAASGAMEDQPAAPLSYCGRLRGRVPPAMRLELSHLLTMTGPLVSPPPTPTSGYVGREGGSCMLIRAECHEEMRHTHTDAHTRTHTHECRMKFVLPLNVWIPYVMWRDNTL